MDEQERKKYPSLPPDYVTIGMLRERWLKKQEEQKLKEKQEQEVLEETQNLDKDCKNQPHGELEVCHRFENNGPRNGVGKDGEKMALIEEKGKGKEKMGWSGDGRITNKKYYHSQNKKYGAYWKKRNGDIDTEKGQNPRPKEGLDLVEMKNVSKGVEIILKNKVGITGLPCGESSGTQGIGKRVSVGMAEVLPKNSVREGSSQISRAQDVRRDEFRGGFRRNENVPDEGLGGKECGVKLKELKDNNSLGKKMEDEVLQIDRKGNGRKRRPMRQRRHMGDKFKQSGAEMSGLKLNEVELKYEDEISEIGNERDHMKGLHSGTGRNDIKHVNGEVLTEDTLVLENKVENTVLAEKNRNDGFRGYGDRRGNLREKFEPMRQRRHMGDKFQQSGAEMSGLKLNEVELNYEDEISEIGNERDRMKGLHSGTGRNDIKHVNGEVLTADTLVLENNVENTVPAEKNRNGGFRGYGDRRGNLREKFENLTIDDGKRCHLGSKVERKFRGNSRHVNSGRFEIDRKMKQSNCSMVWVKKEQSGAVGGEPNSVGVPPDE